MNFVLAFLIAIGTGTWLYAKILRPRTMDAKTPLIASTAVAIILFIIIYFTANIFLPAQ